MLINLFSTPETVQIPAMASCTIARLILMQLDHLTPRRSRPETLPSYMIHSSTSAAVIPPTMSSSSASQSCIGHSHPADHLAILRQSEPHVGYGHPADRSAIPHRSESHVSQNHAADRVIAILSTSSLPPFVSGFSAAPGLAPPVSSSIPVIRVRGFGHTNLLLTRVTSIFWATLPFCCAFSQRKKVERHQKKNQNTHCLFAGRALGWPPVSSKLALLTDGQNNHQKSVKSRH